MKTSIKTIQDVNALSDIRTYVGGVRKSAKPALPTTHILDLSMQRNERDRIVKELKKLKKRKEQLMKRLKEVEKNMDKLLIEATKTAETLRGKKSAEDSGQTKKKGKMILEY